jgi:5'-hydroxyaverantin dehydrogenase
MSSSVDLSALKGKSALITGGASGLGLATTQSFAAAGAYVTIADVQEVGMKIAQELTNQGYHVTYTHCDVTSWESQIKAFKTAIMFAPENTLDVVAMFAGTAEDRGNVVDHVQTQEVSLDKDPTRPSIKPLDTNLTGVYYSTYLALNYFRLKPKSQDQVSQTNDVSKSLPSKSLIFVSSLAGYIDYPGHSLYNAGKFGVRGLFRSVRSRAKEMGVRCNLLAPWYIKTPMTAPISEALKARGIKDGKGVTFVPIEDVVEAAGRCAVDQNVDGMLRLEPLTVVKRYH